MTHQDEVKVFISWSGPRSRSVAQALRSWLPVLFDRVAPWASDTDISAGQRGLAQIEAELARTSFGIVVVTPENQHAPWLNFEAGALSKTVIDDPEQRVVPVLVGLSSPTDLTGPLAQFQAKLANESGMRDVVLSLASIAGVAESTAKERFNNFWPRLKSDIDSAHDEEPNTGEAVPATRAETDILDEILMHVRSFRSGYASQGLVPTTTESMHNEFHRFVTELAGEHGMRVFDIQKDGYNEYRITLEAKDAYSEDSEKAVRRAFADAAVRKNAKLEVTVVPF